MQKCSILLTSYHITLAIFAETLAVFFSLTMFHHFFLNDFHQFGNKNAVKRFTQRVLRANFSNLFGLHLSISLIYSIGWMCNFLTFVFRR